MSSHPLGGLSRPGRIIGPSLDKIIKNASWRKHTNLISSAKSSLDLLQDPHQQDPNPNNNNNQEQQQPCSPRSSPLLGLSPSVAASVLSPLLLALDPSLPPKILDPALDCLHRLISLRLLRSGSIPSSLLVAACNLTSSVSDESLELAILKLLVAAVRSDALRPRGEALVHILKACYNVYLGSHAALNQIVAKLVLAQILAIVYARVEADSFDVRVKTVNVADLLDLSDKSLNDANLVQAAQGFIDEAMEWSGDASGGDGKEMATVGGSIEGDGGLSAIREDGIFLFRNLCKFSMKFAAPESPEDPLLLRGKVLSLELLKMVMESAGPIWRTNDK